MRLTLRTLLAYLDDTLQANEIKQIGQKVAESDAAQELIDRIKQVTRRRRITTPPATGPNARFDANVVAEYLDNELPSDEVAELEKVCLESDVHLAEIAACHQILTLVLGEPALVPPTARQRMYKLVQGREASPSRRATAAAAAAKVPEEADELEGLHGDTWLRWVLPLAGLFLIVALGLTFWQLQLPKRDNRAATTQPAQTGDLVDKGKVDATNEQDLAKEKEALREKEAKEKEAKKEEAKKEEAKTPEKEAKKEETKPLEGEATKKEETKKEETKEIKTQEKETPVGRVLPPSKERVPLLRYVAADASASATPSVLVYKPAGKDGWQRVSGGDMAYSTDPLVSLPGYASELRSKDGVGLLLRGHLREFSRHPFQNFLMESGVVLHKSNDVDLDLTLDRGRIYLTNRKEEGPAKIRLRFADEVWDLTLLVPGAEAGVDLVKEYVPGINYRKGEEPRADLALSMIKGEAELRIDAYHTFKMEAAPGPALFMWSNSTKAQGPFRLNKAEPIWEKGSPDTDLAKNMTMAMKDLSLRLTSKRTVENALQDSLERETPWARLLALYSFAAVDDVGKLVDYLGDEAPEHYKERNTAIFALRRWLSRNAAQGPILYDEEKKSGVLIDKRYRNSEADIIFTLLHEFSQSDRNNPDTYDMLAEYLRHRRVAIAELAWYQLTDLAGPANSPDRVKLPPFNAAVSQEEREKATMAIKELVAKKQLPYVPAGSKNPVTPASGVITPKKMP